MQESVGERHLGVHSHFASSVQHILFEWFLRWEVSDHTIAALWGAASRICPKNHATLLYFSQLAFPQEFCQSPSTATIQ